MFANNVKPDVSMYKSSLRGESGDNSGASGMVHMSVKYSVI